MTEGPAARLVAGGSVAGAGAGGPGADEAAARWLDAEEMAAWLPFVQLVTLLPQALDRQLREDAGIPHVYYQILAMLSEAPQGELRMGDLARRSGTSLSRLSHAVSALEDKGWVQRCRPEHDRRGQLTRLTPEGCALLVRVAPGHVREVRRLVVDRLSREEVRHLAVISAKLLHALSG